MKFIRNWKISLPAAGIVLAGLAWLAFGFFGIHTAFVDDEVAEALPEFATPAVSVDEAAVDEAAVEPETSAVEQPAPDADPVATGQSSETVVDSTEPTATAPVSTEPDVAAVPEIVVEASGAFSGTSSYDVSGEAVVLGNGTGQRFVRFEEFESSNGPDLNVYLFNPDDPNDFIDLGELKGNIGEQNYEIAPDVDLDRYSQVSIWCVRFGVGFGSADLTAA